MADHSKPTTTSTYSNFVTELDGRLDDLALGLDPATTSPTNVPTNSIRWNSANTKWQKWNGTAWGDLSSSYSVNINGTVGSTTPDAGAFTTLTSSSTTTLNGTTIPSSVTLVSTAATQTLTNKTLTSPVITGGSIDNSPIGGTTQNSGSFTSLTTSSTVTLNGGLANSVPYLNATKVLTTGNALKFNGSSLVVSNTLANDITYDSKSFDLSTQEIGVIGISFRPDGKLMYVLGTGGDDITYYSLSTAWDVSTAIFVSQSNSTTAQNATPQGMYFKPDGTKVFITGSSAPAGIWAYSCAAPWDVSTITYDSKTLNLSSQTTAPTGVWFKPDGTKMFIASNTGTYVDSIIEYGLSTAWDISTGTFTASLSVASRDTAPNGVQFTDDGMRMFVCGNQGDSIVIYDLSTAWDISTATFLVETSNVSTLTGATITPTDLYVEPNGQKLYILSDTGTGAGTNMVYQFTALSPATINLTGNTTISGTTTINGTTIPAGSNLAVITTTTGSASIPYGTQAQRDASPVAGYFRFNSDVSKFEGYNGTAWGSVGGGATGGGSDDIFVENGQTVTTNYTITSGKNAMSAGPITINTGVSVTIPSGSFWTIV